jgi:hypothetical protein
VCVCVREREKGRTSDDGDTSGSSGMLAGNRSGQAGLKEGADVAVGVRSPQERPKHKTPQAGTLGKEEQLIHC